MLKKAVLFPFMAALYPVLALLAGNLGQIGLGDAGRAIIVVFLLSGGLLVLLRWLTNSWSKAGILTTLVLILFFSYGHVYRWLEATTIVGFSLGRHRFLVPVYGITLLLGFLAVGRLKKLGEGWLVFLNTLGISMVLLALMQIGAFQWSRLQAVQRDLAGIPDPADRFEDLEIQDMPDIYFIILDEYGRHDVLQEIYGFDNSNFEQALTERGFQVLSESRTSYAQTELVMSATLNLNYVQALGGDVDSADSDRAILWDWIRYNRVLQALEEVGYTTIAFATGFHWSQLEAVDDYRQPPLSLLDQLRTVGVTNAFEGVLMQNSAGLILIDALQKFQADLDYPYRMHRSRILFTLDQLTDVIPSLPGPKFVFAHIIAPHGPPVLGPNGEADVNQDPEQAYVDEITFLNRRLLAMIGAILAVPDRPAIIILQSDTGPAVHLNWDSPDEETLWARMTIFNAIYLPDEYWLPIPIDLGSINTFRLIFNQYSMWIIRCARIVLISPIGIDRTISSM
jgi:hypothetical protein